MKMGYRTAVTLDCWSQLTAIGRLFHDLDLGIIHLLRTQKFPKN